MAACGRTPTVQSHSLIMYRLPVPISAVYHSMYMYNVCVRVELGARVFRSDAMKIKKKWDFLFFHIKYTTQEHSTYLFTQTIILCYMYMYLAFMFCIKASSLVISHVHMCTKKAQQKGDSLYMPQSNLCSTTNQGLCAATCTHTWCACACEHAQYMNETVLGHPSIHTYMSYVIM